jgi:crotonobetainyl-CoA:carnitine CoA-transferase CaiB-like acyl-CoA transferase
VETAMNEIPALGQQTDAILGEMKFDAETIAAWRLKGVI